MPNDAPRRCSLLLLALPIQARWQSLQEHEPGVRNQAGVHGWQLVPWLTLAAGASPWALHKVELPHRRPTAACPSYAHNHGAWSEWGARKGAVLPALPVGGRDCGHFQRLLLGRYTAVWAVNCTLARHLGGTLPHPTHCTPASAAGGNSCIPIIWRLGQDGHGIRNRQGAIPLYTSSRAPFSAVCVTTQNSG